MPDHRTHDHPTEPHPVPDDTLQAEPQAPATPTLDRLFQARELPQRLTGLHLVHGHGDELTMFGAHLALLHCAVNDARTPVWLAAHNWAAHASYAGIPAQAHWVDPPAPLDVAHALMRTRVPVPLLIVIDKPDRAVFFRASRALSKIARYGQESQTAAVLLIEHLEHVPEPLLQEAASVTRIEPDDPRGARP